ncbi:MAG: flagellar basal body P-ring formation chaperone FlgA, partial [Leptospira sp.]|nr:flagellar basal body P-ring formation chaperone FlgA [Leptospira sp.]
MNLVKAGCNSDTIISGIRENRSDITDCAKKIKNIYHRGAKFAVNTERFDKLSAGFTGFFLPSLRIFAVIFSFFFFAPMLFADGNAYLKQRVLLNGETVKLSDIAKLDKGVEDFEIFTKLDSPRKIGTDELTAILKSRPDFKGFVLGKECLVVPLTKKFDKEEIRDSLEKEIVTKSKLTKDKFRLTYLGKEENLPAQGVRLDWANFPKQLGAGRRIFSLDIYFENEKIFSKRLSFLLETSRDIVVAKRRIPKGTLLGKDDCELKKIFLEENENDFFEKSISGYTALAAIEEGVPVRKKFIRELFAVEKGSDVSLVYTKANIVVKTKGKARVSGNVGDVIQVIGQSGNSILSARIAD